MRARNDRGSFEGAGRVESKSSLCSTVERTLDLIRNICILASSIALVVLVAIFAWLVFGRYVLNATPTWVEQFALVLICYIVFLGAAAGVKDGNHLGVDFIREAMPRQIRRALRIVAQVIMAGFGLVMMVNCLELVAFGWSTRLPMLDIPEGVRTLPAAICGGLVLIFASGHAISRIMKYWINRPTADDRAHQTWD